LSYPANRLGAARRRIERATAMRRNIVVLLLGYAGSGKLTIARALAPAIGALVVDNHWINNPIFGLLGTDGVTPLDRGVWHEVDRVRAAVMETIAAYSPPDMSFVFTYCAFEEDPGDHRSYALMRSTAERRGALFVPVRLLCSEAELVRRVAMPDRKERLKSVNPEEAIEERRTRTILDPRHPNQLTLDVSELTAAAAADAIERHVGTFTRPD
jgi:hypothetical protein